MRSGVSVTAERTSVCLSVSLSHNSAAAHRCGGFAAVGRRPRDIDLLLHGRRSAAARATANASSVTLSADVDLLAETTV